MAYDGSGYRRWDDADGQETPPSGFRPDDSRYGESLHRDELGADAGSTARSAYADHADPYAEPAYVAEVPRETRRARRFTDEDTSGSVTTTGPGISPAVLDDVFDDPAHGEPGRDRLAVHVIWEVVLLVAALGLAYLLHLQAPDVLRGASLRTLLVSATALGLLALAAGLSLRTAAPNLALGPVAVASAAYFADHADRGVIEAMLPVVAVAAGLGLVLGLVIVTLHVPAWAASLGAALAVVAYTGRWAEPVAVRGGYDPMPSAYYLFGGLAAVALVAGVVGTIKPVRRSVGRFRPVADPARRRGGLAAVFTTGAMVFSTVFAVVAGVLIAAGGDGPVDVGQGFQWTGVALGVALLGGTSAYGRRGGVAGTLLAAVLATLAVAYADERNWNLDLALLAVATVGVGLMVTRLVESFGRPRSAADADSGWGADDSGWSGGWQTGRSRTWPVGSTEYAETWPGILPAQPTDSGSQGWGTDTWRGDGWGANR